MRNLAVFVTWMTAASALAELPKTDMEVAAVKADMMEPTGELYDEVWNGPSEQGVLLVQITTTSKGETFVPGRKLEVLVTQGPKKLQRRSLELEGGSMTGKRRFVLTSSPKWERCEPIKVQVTITGQTKSASKSTVFSVQCGD